MSAVPTSVRRCDAGGPRRRRIQAALDEVIRKGDVPGLSAALIRDGRVVWTGASGHADIASGLPARPSTVYLWFSMTKIATATAVLQLAERGVLDLDEPVTNYVPEFPAARAGGEVTIRHLLSHSSGLPSPIPVRWVHPPSVPAPDPGELTRRLLARTRKLKGVPGARASYSNLGYLVLGEAVAAASGQTFEDYVRENLLAPLGMARTDFRYRGDMEPDPATGYQRRWSPLTPLYRVMLPKGILGRPSGRFVAFNRFLVDGPAYGGLVGPVEDAACFLALHAGGGRSGVLSPAGITSMQQITASGRKLDVGLGWFRRRSDRPMKVRYLEHLGGGGGFWNMMRLFPDLGAGVIVMGNATSYDHQRIAFAALDTRSYTSSAHCAGT